MTTVTIHEAEAGLLALIDRAEAGEEMIIMRGEEPVARLTPVEKDKPKRVRANSKGR